MAWDVMSAGYIGPASINASAAFRSGAQYWVMFQTLKTLEVQRQIAETTEPDLFDNINEYYRKDPYRGSLTDIFL